jgi:hypothetical protein
VEIRSVQREQELIAQRLHQEIGVMIAGDIGRLERHDLFEIERIEQLLLIPDAPVPSSNNPADVRVLLIDVSAASGLLALPRTVRPAKEVKPIVPAIPSHPGGPASRNPR